MRQSFLSYGISFFYPLVNHVQWMPGKRRISDATLQALEHGLETGFWKRYDLSTPETARTARTVHQSARIIGCLW